MGLTKIKKKLSKKLLKLLTNKANKELAARWDEQYGPFDTEDYSDYEISGLPNESGIYLGEMIKWAKDIKPKKMLFAGDNIETTRRVNVFIGAKEVFSAGLLDSTYTWDYELSPDIPNTFDFIATQAMIEHLLSPFQHIEDLKSLLSPNGYILIHTVLPGFPYHRHPIDSVRFFPDFFEGVAKRLNLQIVKKKIRKKHIIYLYQKR